jgi:hypothetical protein
VERITPIYRADHAHERLIRTANGTMHNQEKLCSVACCWRDMSIFYTFHHSILSLQVIHSRPISTPSIRVIVPKRISIPWVETNISPAAGALLIGKSVLARRIDDGYFYLGTVKSQVRFYENFFINCHAFHLYCSNNMNSNVVV